MQNSIQKMGARSTCRIGWSRVGGAGGRHRARGGASRCEQLHALHPTRDGGGGAGHGAGDGDDNTTGARLEKDEWGPRAGGRPGAAGTGRHPGGVWAAAGLVRRRTREGSVGSCSGGCRGKGWGRGELGQRRLRGKGIRHRFLERGEGVELGNPPWESAIKTGIFSSCDMSYQCCHLEPCNITCLRR
jgi:hypothetical protein